MTQPQQQVPQPRLETVIVEVDVTPDGQPAINVRGLHLQAPPEALWERIIGILHGGLRAAIVQTVTPQAAAARIVDPAGWVLPPPPARH